MGYVAVILIVLFAVFIENFEDLYNKRKYNKRRYMDIAKMLIERCNDYKSFLNKDEILNYRLNTLKELKEINNNTDNVKEELKRIYLVSKEIQEKVRSYVSLILEKKDELQAKRKKFTELEVLTINTLINEVRDKEASLNLDYAIFFSSNKCLPVRSFWILLCNLFIL